MRNEPIKSKKSDEKESKARRGEDKDKMPKGKKK